MSVITVPELERWLRSGVALQLIDVRRATRRGGDGDQIAGWREGGLPVQPISAGAAPAP